jgi:hypothetical protein
MSSVYSVTYVAGQDQTPASPMREKVAPQGVEDARLSTGYGAG